MPLTCGLQQLKILQMIGFPSRPKLRSSNFWASSLAMKFAASWLNWAICLMIKFHGSYHFFSNWNTSFVSIIVFVTTCINSLNCWGESWESVERERAGPYLVEAYTAHWPACVGKLASVAAQLLTAIIMARELHDLVTCGLHDMLNNGLHQPLLTDWILLLPTLNK